MNEEPVSVLAEGAAAMHELFLTFVAAGFTEIQALVLVAHMFRPQS